MTVLRIWLLALLLTSSFTYAETLRVYAAAQVSEMQPLLFDFQRRHPDVDLEYKVFNSNKLNQYIRNGTQPQPDVTISSVMDLQFRLVNDGYALPYRPVARRATNTQDLLPRWAVWRDELYGFSFEPAVIVLNKAFMKDKVVPKSRVELLSFIRRYGDELNGKIGTYDIRAVGIGYLLWSFERIQAANYGQILELFKQHNARTFPSSVSMLSALRKEELLLAYNIMGSYARSWEERYGDIIVVAAEDYTPVVIRSAFINKTTEVPDAAKRFLNYLVSYKGQQMMARETNMPPIRLDIDSPKSANFMRANLIDQLKPIPMDVTLLVSSDQNKREIVITEWENALKEFE
ncbi:Bacterial extracellular solute-binding protein [Grimontia celer]|uniref:Bacterial extracellular solute-binding protein n=1 Tax=Grimontia celer TaxID=1796497 RepID=A0A128F1K3_9GAMM|nr:ABC transporter substrate-binding protein [Grimontia celer]CZF80659.1 Bacterial extracellular solute-binding protein [Grimontia celer]